MKDKKLYKSLIKENESEFQKQYAEFYKWCNQNYYVLKNNKEYFYAEPLPQEERLLGLRKTRKPLLDAFDKWEKAVLRGRESESLEIMTWYFLILDLNETALNNVPERVKYYL